MKLPLYLFLSLLPTFDTYFLSEVLGTLLNQADSQLKNTIATLASVPEFFLSINSLVKRNLSAIDGDHLQFIFSNTNLFDLENKLTVARKILVALDNHANNDIYNVNDDDSDYENSYDDNSDDEIIPPKGPSLRNYPILRSTYASHRIYLSRDDPWKSFFLYAAGYYNEEGGNKLSVL